jgi:hypothetical protein
MSFNPDIEKVAINISKETIYLKQLTSNSFDESVISKKSYTANKPDTVKEYVDWRGRYFFYEIKDDNLIIYGGNWCNARKNLIENIKFINIDDSITIYKKEYRKLGLKVFPPSEEKFLK